MWHDGDVMPAAPVFLHLIADFVVYLGLLIRRRRAIAAENLFLRRQFALYQSARAVFDVNFHQFPNMIGQSFSFFADHRRPK